MSARPPVVLAGSRDDDHVAALVEALRARDVPTFVLDALRFPESVRLSLGEGADHVVVDGVRLGVPRVMYLRSLYLSPTSYLVDAREAMEQNWQRTMIAFREKGELLLGLLRRWEAEGTRLYNPLSAGDRTRKPYQLALLARAGLPVPKTLWTNDPEAVMAFAREQRVVVKPIAGGAATKELSAAMLVPEKLARLGAAPVTFQELLPGENLRVFVLDGRIVAAYRIHATELDYRQNEEGMEAFTPDDALANVCLRATEVLGLRFTGMDLKGDAAGVPKILELNPSPMFLGFDQRTGTDILGALADALALP